VAANKIAALDCLNERSSIGIAAIVQTSPCAAKCVTSAIFLAF
jgi:hypothetical protein